MHYFVRKYIFPDLLYNCLNNIFCSLCSSGIIVIILISCIGVEQVRAIIFILGVRVRVRGLARGGGLCRFIVIAIFGYCILWINITNIWFTLGFGSPTVTTLYASLLTLSHSCLQSDHKCPLCADSETVLQLNGRETIQKLV